MFKNELFISDSTKTIRSLALNFYALVVVILILRTRNTCMQQPLATN